MAREMAVAAGEIFSAEVTVIEKYYGEDFTREDTYRFGPFADGRQAAAAITRERTDLSKALIRAHWIAAKYPDSTALVLEDALIVGKVQRSDISWQAV